MQKRERAMRVHNGNYAYELSLVRDRGTQMAKGWEYRIYRTRSSEELLHIATHPVSRGQAEREAKRIIHTYNKIEKLQSA